MDTTMGLTRRFAAACLLIAAFLCAMPTAVRCSDLGASMRLTAGYGMTYLDEPWQGTFGGSVRIGVSPRFSIEPEFVVSPGSRFTQWTLIPNVVVNLADPESTVVPYLIGGIGYFHELDKAIDYTRNELAWSIGVGIRVPGRKGVFFSPEFRLGHITRMALGAGYSF
jgi:hypothetical protein